MDPKISLNVGFPVQVKIHQSLIVKQGFALTIARIKFFHLMLLLFFFGSTGPALEVVPRFRVCVAVSLAACRLV